jgi:hypothetical protein
MRNARFVIALVAATTTLAGYGRASAQERARAFADVPFGSGPSVVLEAMVTLGLEPFAAPPDDHSIVDQRFEGRRNGQHVLVTASYDAAVRLEKMVVSFLTPDEECVTLYRALKTELRLKYGAPATDFEQWDFPYDKGGHVGHEHDAIRIGKGMLAAVWEDADAGSTDGGIVLTTEESVVVRLAYESSKWKSEAARRSRILGPPPEPESVTATPARRGYAHRHVNDEHALRAGVSPPH